MTQATSQTRSFRVHARHVDAHHARILEEPSFEAAAVAYAEDLHEMPGDGDEISVIVQDLGTGHQHCFRIDLESGETSSCA
jgi:molecular chaperone DnaK (HSP70)